MKESLNCPKCDAAMKRVTFNGIEVDRCSDCSGIWFDLLEHEDLKAASGSEKVDTGKMPSDASSESRILNCPKCATRMSPTRDLEQSHIVYEKCSVCSGVFFDAGEFRDLKEYTLSEKLKTWLG